MTFPETLRATRQAHVLTQAELADRLGVSSQTLSNWECGRSSPWPKQEANVLLALVAIGLPKPKAPRARICERIVV